MEYKTYTICVLQYEPSNEFNHRLIRRNLAASREHYWQQCKKKTFSDDEEDHLHSE